MSEPSSVVGERALPWIRLMGAVMLGLLLVELVADAWFMSLIELLQAELDFDALPADGTDPYEARNRASRMLGVASGVGLSSQIFGSLAIAGLLLAAAWHARRLRIPAGAAALGFACTTASPLAIMSMQLSRPADGSFEPLTGWFQIGAVACTVAWGGTLALMLAVTRDRPRRALALGCIAVGAVWPLLYLNGSFVLDPEAGPSWVSERVLGLSVGTWLDVVGTLGMGLALWLGSSPTRDEETSSFDLAAARGLRLARTALWWRVGLAFVGGMLAIAGLMVAQRARHRTLFGDGDGESPVPWVLELAPWLGYVEVGFGVLMLVGLLALVLQRRSTAAAVLAGVGGVLLLGATMGSGAMTFLLHEAVAGMSHSEGGFGGSDLSRYAEATAELDPYLRGIGLLGMISVLVGLLALARKSGPASQLRAYRFIGLAVLFTLAWLLGREALAELGSGVLLLAPIVLGAAIWMLLDLATFLREVADGLDGTPPEPQ